MKWALAGLTLVAFVLRLLIVDQTTVGDELFLYEIVHDRSLPDMLDRVHDTESTPPLHFILAWASAKIGGDDLVWIRAPSIVLGTAAVPLVYALGVRTVNRWGALLAAAFFALAPFNIFYASQGRAYAVVAFLSAASTVCLLLALESRKRAWWIAFALVTAAAMFTHYTVIFVLVAQFGWALWAHRSQIRAILLAHAGAAILFLPWIPSLLFQNEDSAAVRIEALYPLTFKSYFDGLARAFVGHPSNLDPVPGPLGGILIGLGFACAIGVLVVRRARQREKRRPPRTLALLVLLAVAAPIGTLLFSLGPTSVFLPRNLSSSVPAAAVLVGALLAAVRSRAVGVVGITLVAAGLVLGAIRTVGPELERADYRSAAQYLDRDAAPGDPVVELSIARGPVARQLSYYMKRRHEYFTSERPLSEALPLGRRSGQLFLVAPANAGALVRLVGLEKQGFRRVGKRTFGGQTPVVVIRYVPAR